MAERDRPHLIVPAPPEAEPFTSTQGGGSSEKPEFTGDRAGHGRTLVRQFEQAVRPPDETDTAGTYVSFESFPGLELALQSLDVQRSGEQPELVAVKEVRTGTGTVQIATVYIPDGKRDYFLKRLNDYVETAGEDKAKSATLVEGIAAIRHATIRELWTDPDDEFPTDAGEVVWWEVWLRRHDGHEQERLDEFAERNQLLTSGHYLGFQALCPRTAEAPDSLAKPEFAGLAHSRVGSVAARYTPDVPYRLGTRWAQTKIDFWTCREYSYAYLRRTNGERWCVRRALYKERDRAPRHASPRCP